MSALKPRTKSPELEVETLAAGCWRLSEQRPENFTMIVAYRGLHCPICRTYLSELDRNAEEFGKRGVEVIAVSTDTLERAAQTKDEWKLRNLRIGYGLSIPKAREWGLYISTSRGKTSTGVVEPDQFNEPGVFLIKPDQTLYASSVATMPFARPHFKEVLAAIDFIVEKDYPARGEA
ncbi:MAG: peroxiredoxin-like family protein [Gammaproteobacteria bacterium]|nr:peroxiredoxin-like family protein [Gammaproteobacteria bacterium]